MGYLDNPMQGELRDLLRRVRQLETGSPLGNTSITRGALRVASPEGLIVEGSETVSGTLDVTGTLVLSGVLNGDGTITWTGPTNLQGVTVITGDTTVQGPFHVDGATDINGDTTVTGPFHVKGDTDVTGTIALKGATSLEGDLDVVAPGKITVGAGLSLEPLGAGGGAINFLPTGSISAGLGGITIVSPDLTADLVVGSGGVSLTLPTTSATGKTPNVWQDPVTGKLWRLT